MPPPQSPLLKFLYSFSVSTISPSIRVPCARYSWNSWPVGNVVYQVIEWHKHVVVYCCVLGDWVAQTCCCLCLCCVSGDWVAPTCCCLCCVLGDCCLCLCCVLGDWVAQTCCCLCCCVLGYWVAQETGGEPAAGDETQQRSGYSEGGNQILEKCARGTRTLHQCLGGWSHSGEKGKPVYLPMADQMQKQQPK